MVYHEPSEEINYYDYYIEFVEFIDLIEYLKSIINDRAI